MIGWEYVRRVTAFLGGARTLSGSPVTLSALQEKQSQQDTEKQKHVKTLSAHSHLLDPRLSGKFYSDRYQLKESSSWHQTVHKSINEFQCCAELFAFTDKNILELC